MSSRSSKKGARRQNPGDARYWRVGDGANWRIVIRGVVTPRLVGRKPDFATPTARLKTGAKWLREAPRRWRVEFFALPALAHPLPSI
jgi:hypothetical protein